MILCITILKYLSVLRDPAWDCRAVHNTINLISVMDHMIQHLDHGHEDSGLGEKDSLLKLVSRLLVKCCTWAMKCKRHIQESTASSKALGIYRYLRSYNTIYSPTIYIYRNLFGGVLGKQHNDTITMSGKLHQ